MSRSRRRAKQKLATRQQDHIPAFPDTNGSSNGGDTGGQVRAEMISLSETWSGPLPRPQELAKFDEIVPGSAERIIRMAEIEGEHVRHAETYQLRHLVRTQYLGMGSALVIALTGMALSAWLGMQGHTIVACAVAGFPLATMVAAFLGKKAVARKTSK